MYAHSALRSSAIMTLTHVPPCVPQVQKRHLAGWKDSDTAWWHHNSEEASPRKSRAEDWQTGWWQDYSDACSESTDASPRKNRENEKWRHGLLGGRKRHGERGGHDRVYYRGYYAAKGKDKAKGKGSKENVQAYIGKWGPPPTRGGKSFHDRREDADIVNAEEAGSQHAATSSWSTTSAPSAPSQATWTRWGDGPVR